MAKIPRKIQLIFGEDAPAAQIKQFGSLAAGTPVNATDVDQAQALSNYLQGWYGAVIAGNSPAIEDMNALFYVLSYNLAYLQQAGVPEWYATTEYYIGSIANDGFGNLYVSLADNNLGNALTDATKWNAIVGGSFTLDPSVTPSLDLSAGGYRNALIGVETAAGVSTVTLPAAAAGYAITLKDVDGEANRFPITVAPVGGAQIEGLAASYICEAAWGSWTFSSNGTNWFLI